MIAVTGASGQLGQLVLQSLIDLGIKPEEIVAAVRSPKKIQKFIDLGVQARFADYNQPESLKTAFVGVKKILLISANEPGKRTPQHLAVIHAAKEVPDLELIAYTSLLQADTTPFTLGKEHRETEVALKESGLPYTLLRNGWYSENYTMGIASALEHKIILGSSGDGKISSATRQDYALAAAHILLNHKEHIGKTYELAGDEAFILTDFASLISDISGKNVQYKNLSEQDYKNTLVQVGVPESMASILANSSFYASQNWLYDNSHSLSKIIGRATTPISESIRVALLNLQ